LLFIEVSDMTGSMRALRLMVAALVVSGGLIVASCGGGSVNSTPLAQGTNQPNSTQTLPTGGGTLSIPAAANGQAASVAVAAGVPAGTTITTTSSATAPGSAPAPSSIKRSAEAIAGAVPFFFVTFTVSASVTANLFSSETVSLTSSQPTTASYYVEFDDITSSPGTKLGCAGPGTVANGAATVSNSGASGACTNSGNTPTLAAGHTYLIQFYYVAAGTPSPTPTATSTGASPSPSPSASAGFFTGGSANTGATSNCNTTACAALSVPAPPFSTTVTFGPASAPVEMFVTLGSGLQTPSPGTYTAFTGTGTVEEYLQVSASANVTVAQTPSIVLTGLTGVTKCAFYIFTSNSIWASVSPSTTGTANVTNGSVTLPMAPGVGGNGQVNNSAVNIGTTPAYGAVACS
jgi:hypothetical protein